MNPEIKIFGAIGDPEEGTTAKMFDEAISSLAGESEIDVLINSQGGSVSEGTAIADAIQSFEGTVNTIIVGGACSIAGYIACSGTGRRIIRKKGMLHIHGPQQRTEGNLQDHEDSIEELKHATKQMGEHYAEISGQKFDDIVADFHRDRFYSAEQAVDLGYMTEIDDESNAIVAMRGHEQFKGIPRKFAAAWLQAEESDKPDEDNQMAKATVKEMQKKFRGASAEFLVAQDIADVDMVTATANYIEDLEGRVKTLATANTDIKQQMEAMEDDEAEAMDESPEATIASLRAQIKAMKDAEAMDDDEDEDMYAMDDADAMDDDEAEAMDDDDMKAMDDKDEMEAMKAEIKALKKAAKAQKKGGKNRRRGARAVRTSRTSRGPSRKSADAVVKERVSVMMRDDPSLRKSDAARAVYKEDPKLRERMLEEANGE